MFVIGHKNPDTDSVVSATVLSKFLQKTGRQAEARVPGKINKETEYIFSFLNLDVPAEIAEIPEDEKVFLVDHNDLSQSLASIDSVVGILDHHLLSGIITDSPMYFRVEPIGSTSSLVYKLYKENNVELEITDANLLLAAIISDTLKLSSPTTTDEDRLIFEELKEITKIDTDKLAQEMFAHKSDYSDKSISEVISSDLKEFDFGGKRVAISVAETTNLDYFNNNEDEIAKELVNIKNLNNYDYFFFAAVDIVNKNTHFFPAEDVEKKIIEELFIHENKGNYYYLENIVSRKKEIAPVISKYFA